MPSCSACVLCVGSSRTEDGTQDDQVDDLEDEAAYEDDHAQDHAFEGSDVPVPKPNKHPRCREQREHKRTALRNLLATAPPPRIIHRSSQSRRATRNEDATLINDLRDAIGVRDSSPAPRSPERKAGSRRKSVAPQSLSSPARSRRNSPLIAGVATRNEDGTSPLRHWLGFGAIDEPTGPPSSRKPFSIQNWLIAGYQRKHSEESATRVSGTVP